MKIKLRQRATTTKREYQHISEKTEHLSIRNFKEVKIQILPTNNFPELKTKIPDYDIPLGAKHDELNMIHTTMHHC